MTFPRQPIMGPRTGHRGPSRLWLLHCLVRGRLYGKGNGLGEIGRADRAWPPVESDGSGIEMVDVLLTKGHENIFRHSST